MDEFEKMMSDTFRHFDQHFAEHQLAATEVEEEDGAVVDELPLGPGILYHIQKSTSIFVIRTWVSQNIREDYRAVLTAPEIYPSLRLLEGGSDSVVERLRFFPVDELSQAEIIHDQLSNRRFPVNEEMMCNLSDPGFSWWLTKKDGSFHVSFTLSVIGSSTTVKLGPLGDQQLALHSFQALEHLFQEAGLVLNVQNEMNRVQFSDGEEFLIEELQDLFEYGVVSEGLTQLFKLLARNIADHAQLESAWFYLQELACMRRFWIQIEFDINS